MGSGCARRPLVAGRVVILVENEPYPYDRRVRREALALTAHGYDVTVVSPTGPHACEPQVEIDGVGVRRFPAPPEGTGVVGYVREYAAAGYRLRRIIDTLVRGPRFDVAVACNPPDFLIHLARPLRRRGAGLIFDYHDPSPELFEAMFGRRGLPYRALLALERTAFKTADVVMTVNDACKDIVTRRGGVEAENVFVVRNSPDPRDFFPVEPQPALRRGRNHLVLWVGRMSHKERLPLLLDAAERLVSAGARTDVSFALVGRGDVLDELRAEVDRRRLRDVVALPGEVGDETLRRYMSTADVCVSLDQRNPMNDHSLMVKVLEYMAMGRAVVQFPLAEMRRVCGDSTVYARDGDATDLAAKIAELLDDPQRRAQLGQAAARRLRNGLGWPDQIPALLDAVELAASRGRAAAGR